MSSPHHVLTLADDLGVDEADVRLVAAWLTEQPAAGGTLDDLDDELERGVRAVLDPGGERTARERAACPGCGRLPGPYLVLIGWQPCRCGGHRTTLCPTESGGCGHERFEPELREGCVEPAFGFAPPSP